MLLGLVIAGCMVGCSSEEVTQEETPEQQVEQEVDSQDVSQEYVEEEEKESDKIDSWMGHEFGKYEFVVTDGDGSVVIVRKISKMGSKKIKFTYAYINETGDTDSGFGRFTLIPYQNGIKMDTLYGMDEGNGDKTIQDGIMIEDCYEYIEVGDGSTIECEVNVGLWNQVATLTIDPNTLEYSLE
jgi:hypothetical protein